MVEEIRSAGGEAIEQASVSDKVGAQSIIDDAVAAYGTVDILVNNAGILRDKSFKTEMDDWDIVMDVHLNGSAYDKAAWPIMYDKKYGRIVLLVPPRVFLAISVRLIMARLRWVCSVL